jgi:hypothetical protein
MPKHLIRQRNERLLEAAGGRCAWCSTALSLATLTVDHVVCRVAGGSDWEGNLLASREACNNARGHLAAAAFAMRCPGHQRRLLVEALRRTCDPQAHQPLAQYQAERAHRRRLYREAKAFSAGR